MDKLDTDNLPLKTHPDVNYHLPTTLTPYNLVTCTASAFKISNNFAYIVTLEFLKLYLGVNNFNRMMVKLHKNKSILSRSRATA